MTFIGATQRRLETGQSASSTRASNSDRSGAKKSFSRGNAGSNAGIGGQYGTTLPSFRQQSLQVLRQQYLQPHQLHDSQPQYGMPANTRQGGAPNGASNQQPVYAANGLSPAMAQMWQQQPQHRSLTEVSAGVINFLGQAGVNARLGGSLAARANGGMRKPGDVDFEVASTGDLQRAHQLLSNVNTMVTMPDGLQVRMQGRALSYVPGRSGLVDLKMTYPNGEVRQIEADVVNENCYGLDPHIYSPWQRQTNPGNYAGNLAPSELVVNSLSRHMFKPHLSEKKEDVYQIAAMLRHAGMVPHQELAVPDFGMRIAQEFKPEHQALAQQKFREIVQWMANGQV